MAGSKSKRFNPEQIVVKLRQAEKLQGVSRVKISEPSSGLRVSFRY